MFTSNLFRTLTVEEKPRSAREWPLWRRRVTVVIVAVFAFLCTFAAAIIAPGREQMMREFNVGTIVAIIPFSLFNLGLAMGSVVTSTLSEAIGRVGVYAVCMPGLMFFTLGVGLSKTIQAASILRFFAGLFASPAITIASAVIADMFATEDRGIPLFCYYSMPWTGSVMGPLIGYQVVTHKTWPWTQWVFLMIAFPIVLMALLFMEETYETKIVAKLEPQGKTPNILTQCQMKLVGAVRGFPSFMRHQVWRPIKMLCTEPIVGLVCLYAGFNFGLVYSLIIASPDVFNKAYGFGLAAQGNSFLGLVIGCLIGVVLLIIDYKFFYRSEHDILPISPPPSAKPSPAASNMPSATTTPATSNPVSPTASTPISPTTLTPTSTTPALTPIPAGTALPATLPTAISPTGSEDTLVETGGLPADKAMPITTLGTPERRLHGAMFGGCILPMGLIWFAWTARPTIHWICPIISQVLITCGALTVYVSLSTYLVDTYGPKFGASAQAASSITRYTFATGIPLFITPMYNNLGTGWATSILALAALLLCPIPFFFYIFGARLRARCHYETTG